MPLNHGFLILDKPLGISSAKAVAEVKKILACKKIGHGGTLDPLASGVLPLAIGEATKAFDYVASAVKAYRFTITFGEQRDTDDAEGAVTARTHILPSRGAIEAALISFTGILQQIPPVYSAIKVAGERAYKMARAGEEVVLEPRPVEVHSFVLTEVETGPDGILRATCEVTCGKGTYIRALARDLSIKINTLGYISMLRRTAVGKFRESEAISLDKLAQSVHNAALLKAWVPIEFALDDILAINVDPKQATALRQGQSTPVSNPDGKYKALCDGQIVALAEVTAGRLKPIRVFNLNP